MVRSVKGSGKKGPVKKSAAASAPSKSAAETREIMGLLFQQHPNAFTELNFRNPYELLVATILSAQSTDRRVNEVTPALFAKYPDATSLATANPGALEGEIKSTGFFRQKTKSLIGMAKAVVENFNGVVPGTMEGLVTLTGVGRKTANVVLSHAFGVPGLAVDRHVLRVANRIGIVSSSEPEEVEAQLCAVMPPEQWQLTSDTLILHGRRICRPFPLCPKCAVVELCDFGRELLATAKLKAKAPKAPKAAAKRQPGIAGIKAKAGIKPAIKPAIKSAVKRTAKPAPPRRSSR